ncbi:MAG: hypothetical protein JNL83_34780 [Myxococcales bacterium]|nr:hypothetical protein [Myxococcales bacterium]
MRKLGLSLVLVSSLAFADKAAAPPPPAKKAAPAAAAPAVKPVKQMSRGELEAEVEALRAHNAKLKTMLDELVAKEKERAARMEKAVGQPASTLK